MENHLPEENIEDATEMLQEIVQLSFQSNLSTIKHEIEKTKNLEAEIKKGKKFLTQSPMWLKRKRDKQDNSKVKKIRRKKSN